MSIERLPSEEFFVKEAVTYEDVHDLKSLFNGIAFEDNLLLKGHKGIGKTLSVVAYCKARNYPLVTVDCSEDLRRSHLFGGFIIRDQENPFVLGPVTTAFEVANEIGHCVIVFEELNALAPSVQKLINPLTDFRRKLEVPEAKKVFRLREGAKLWVVGTMNFSNYGGAHELNEDLLSRFHQCTVGYPSPDQEKRVLTRLLGDRLDAKTISHLVDLGKKSRQEQVEYKLSTRELVGVGENIIRFGARSEWAKRLMLDKYEDIDRKTVEKWAESADLF